MKDDKGGRYEGHGEDDADGVQEGDADLPDDLRVELLLGEVHRVLDDGHAEVLRLPEVGVPAEVEVVLAGLDARPSGRKKMSINKSCFF